MNLSTTIGRLRLIGILEGISYLLLLGIAMPLKYMAGKPEMVKYTGWAHGLLFVLFIMLLLQAIFENRISIKKGIVGFVASLLPFGTFIFDRQLKDKTAQTTEVKH